VYTSEYGRTGFQGGLNEYRCLFDDKQNAQLRRFSGRTVDVPSIFIGGESDWGVFQTPGALETMRDRICTQMRGIHLVQGAGHWVQQEEPDQVSDILVRFLFELR
jgi:pimeloyl-ACP methyl ester carboxylesterase